VVSLLTIGFLACIWCFFNLETVVNVMTTMLVLVQFIGQGIGLCVLRYRIWRGYEPDDPEAWTIKYLPLVVVPQLTIFIFIFITTDNWIVGRQDPILELSLVFLLVGAVFFFGHQRLRRAWPFARKRSSSDKMRTVNIDLQTSTTSRKMATEEATEEAPEETTEETNEAEAAGLGVADFNGALGDEEGTSEASETTEEAPASEEAFVGIRGIRDFGTFERQSTFERPSTERPSTLEKLASFSDKLNEKLNITSLCAVRPRLDNDGNDKTPEEVSKWI